MRRKRQDEVAQIALRQISLPVYTDPNVKSLTLEPLVEKMPLQIGTEITFRLVKIIREVTEE